MFEDVLDLVDRIYEAAVLQELWPAVVADLAWFVGADAGVLFTFDPDGFRFVASPNLPPASSSTSRTAGFHSCAEPPFWLLFGTWMLSQSLFELVPRHRSAEMVALEKIHAEG